MTHDEVPESSVQPDVEESTISTSAVLFVLICIASILSLMILALFFSLDQGEYILVVKNENAWLYNTMDKGGVVGPFDEIKVADGTYLLTGSEVLEFGKVLFKDETVTPGRFRFEVSSHEFDVMEVRVIYEGQDYPWQPTDVDMKELKENAECDG